MREMIFEITVFERIEERKMILMNEHFLEKKKVLYKSLSFLEICNIIAMLRDLPKHNSKKPLL